MQVTDEMVQAAEAAVYARHERGFLMKPLINPIDMSAALTAALSSAPSFKVKELVWKGYDEETDMESALTPGFGLVIVDSKGWRYLNAAEWYESNNISEAKAAAQADYDRRILSALQPTQPEPAVKVDEWQPIETAPRDGGFLAANSKEVWAAWHFDSENWHARYGSRGATRWMPLPAAPLNRIGGAE